MAKKIRCNNCENYYKEEDLIIIEDMRACKVCKTDKYLMDLIELYFTYSNEEGITSHIEADSFEEATNKNQLPGYMIKISEEDLKFITKQFKNKS